jgi:general L-amino acid transport system permease protein
MKAWARGLFGTPVNALLTLALAWLAWRYLPPLWDWAVAKATLDAPNRRGCGPEGACWAFIRARLPLFLVGRYPESEWWRPALVVAGLAALLLAALAPGGASRGRALLALALLYMPAAGLLLAGGVAGLPPVPTGDWGGLLLNLVLTASAVAMALPLAILLAFGRRSEAPVIRLVATIFVEFWRGIPLLAALFLGLVMLPLFLPAGVTPDNLLRALAVLTLFTSAYLAEVVRGGLMGVPRGQDEAARALGLTPLQEKRLVLLPQALRRSVAGIANIVIDLFKDTALVSVVGLFDLTGVVTQSLRDRDWLGLAAEGYAFAAAAFFGACVLLSLGGSALERRLNAPMRR